MLKCRISIICLLIDGVDGGGVCVLNGLWKERGEIVCDELEKGWLESR